jgi:hypothetical protein
VCGSDRKGCGAKEVAAIMVYVVWQIDNFH